MQIQNIIDSLNHYHPETKLCNIPVADFEEGGNIHNALTEAGHTDDGLIVINNLRMWGSTVEQLEKLLTRP